MAVLPGIQPERRFRHARYRGAVVLLAGAIILSACGTDSGNDVPEDRQFANEPAPTRQATGTPGQAPTEAVIVEPTERSAATPANLLRTRGAPSSLYTVSDNRLVVLEFGENGPEARTIGLPDGAEVLGIASSPTGDRVGALLAANDGKATFVQFYDRDGEGLGGPYSLQPGATPVASPAATPMASPAAISAIPESDEPVSGTSISWIPQENGVLVVRDNSLYSIDVERGIERIPTDMIDGTIIHAAASPMGGRILVQAVLDDGSHVAWLLPQPTGKSHELHALRTAPGQGISELMWQPTGNGVVFVEGEVVDGKVLRGQLFTYEFRDEVPRLVATSGQGGPSATITNVAISPDGKAVAYDVSILDGDVWALHSLWVRSLKRDGTVIEVPATSGGMIHDLGWSDAGLTWTSAPRFGPGERSLYIMTPDGEVLDVMPVGASRATPVVSPGATPVASLVASPHATPAASPVALPATPIG